MELDTSKISESPIPPSIVQHLTKGGWILCAKMVNREWRQYYLDGEDGVIKDERVAYAMYERALADPSCENIVLLRVKLERTASKR